MTLANQQTVLFFNHTAKWSGGEISLHSLVTHLDRSRYLPLVVLASEGRLADRLRGAGIETLILPLTSEVTEVRKDALGINSFFHLGRLRSSTRYILKLAQLIRKRRVALVHCNSLKSDLLGGLACKIARTPCVWHVRDRIDSDYLPARVARSFRFLANRLPTAVLANSESTLQSLNVSQEARCLTQIAYPGIPFEDYSFSEPLTKTDPLKRLILVGRITPWKGQHIFLEAAAKIAARWPEARFQIVGTPMFGEEAYERELQCLVEKQGIQNQVEFLGFREDIPALLNQADIFVHASTLGEPFGKVVVEAMASRKAVIATDGGALREIVISGSAEKSERGETGLLVPMNDASAMAAAMETLLQNPERAELMGQNGRCRAEQHFTAERTTRDVEALFDRVLALRAGRWKQTARKPNSYRILL